jgi:hypothetical protein
MRRKPWHAAAYASSAAGMAMLAGLALLSPARPIRQRIRPPGIVTVS